MSFGRKKCKEIDNEDECNELSSSQGCKWTTNDKGKNIRCRKVDDDELLQTKATEKQRIEEMSFGRKKCKEIDNEDECNELGSSLGCKWTTNDKGKNIRCRKP